MSRYFKVSLEGYIRDWRDAEVVVEAENEEEVREIIDNLRERNGLHLDFTDGPVEFNEAKVRDIEPREEPNDDTTVITAGCKCVFIEMNTIRDDLGYDEPDEYPEDF